MSEQTAKIGGMNLNWEQFLKAVERGQALLTELKKNYPELKLRPVFSRFGPRSGQCDLTTDLKKIVMEFPDMLAGEVFSHKKAQNSQKGDALRLRDLLKEIKQAEKEGQRKPLPPERSESAFCIQKEMTEGSGNLWKEADAVEKTLLDPGLELYCGDVLIEYRPGDLKYEPLRRLQQDPRLPPGLNTVGNVRVIVGSLEFLSKKV